MDMQIAGEVAEALSKGRAVVALESTIITHGLPYPQNLEAARQIEQSVRSGGAVPATIAVLDGDVHIGLTPVELETLAMERDVMKVSRNDLPYALLKGRTAATTVATTMWLAEQAGIKFFATGGIGGVHREASVSFDVSADLTELGRTSVCVVSAGAKAILDLPATLEYLETLGVPVIGYRTLEFPAFYCRSSGLQLSLRLDDPDEVAAFCRNKWDMGLSGGVLLANPVPAADEISKETMDGWIHEALQAAADAGVRGKKITPFLLSHINSRSDGNSVRTNVSLVLNNARLAAEVASAWSQGQS